MKSTFDIWQDDILVVLFWMGCIGFGWLIGWTIGSLA